MNNKPATIRQYDLVSETGLTASILNYGARLQSLKVPTKNGPVEVLLGYQASADYLKDEAYLGAIAGRYCNRIANGKYSYKGNDITLSRNAGEHHLHGGFLGLSHKYWGAQNSGEAYANKSIRLNTVSEDGEQGYPGDAEFDVTYDLQGNKLVIDMRAQCTKATPLNLTGHAYFNLNSNDDLALNHQISVVADHYLPIDATCIPTGELELVDGSAFDLRHPVDLKSRVKSSEPAISAQGGFDHNFVLGAEPNKASLAATLYSPQSGISLKLYTTKPGLQVYTGNHLSGAFEPHQGVCLEPQYFPNSPNQANFPCAMFEPGDTYHHQIIYEFECES